MNKATIDIPVHQLSNSPLLIFAIESADDETFDGLHRHDFYELIWFTQTEPGQVIEVDFVSYPIQPDMIHLLAPGQVFRMNKTSQRGYVMALSKELLAEVASPFFAIGSPLPLIQPGTLKSIQQLWPLVVEEYQQKNRIQLLKAYLTAFFFQVFDSVATADMPIAFRSHELLRLIDQYYLTQRKISFYAQALKLSTKNLNALLKKERGVTLKELILQRLVLEAKREINFGQLSFKEIAFKLGFDDPAYFSRFFKAQTGSSAEQFKASIQQRSR